jgi:bacterioferritin-associated ferredoxin
MDRSTMICRCEEINLEEIQGAVNLGAKNHDDIKRLTRCGMGPCQAKTCRSLVAEAISSLTGRPLEDIPVPRIRVPLRPILIGVLANYETNTSTVRSILRETDVMEGRE